MPLPVFALDQCLFGERITPMDYRIKSSRLSDHRLGVFEFVVGDGNDTMEREHKLAE
jgi:hypothetical protein